MSGEGQSLVRLVLAVAGVAANGGHVLNPALDTATTTISCVAACSFMAIQQIHNDAYEVHVKIGTWYS